MKFGNLETSYRLFYLSCNSYLFFRGYCNNNFLSVLLPFYVCSEFSGDKECRLRLFLRALSSRRFNGGGKGIYYDIAY